MNRSIFLSILFVFILTCKNDLSAQSREEMVLVRVVEATYAKHSKANVFYPDKESEVIDLKAATTDGLKENGETLYKLFAKILAEGYSLRSSSSGNVVKEYIFIREK